MLPIKKIMQTFFHFLFFYHDSEFEHKDKWNAQLNMVLKNTRLKMTIVVI